MKKFILIKLIGLSILAMIVLVTISFIEVAFYSYVINPGQHESFYETHANISAPYISCIFGFILFYFTTRYWTKKGYTKANQLCIQFPLMYLTLDVVIITTAGVNWEDFILIFFIANASKLIGSYMGYFLHK